MLQSNLSLNKVIDIQNHKKLALEYSEQPEQLEKILKEIEISIRDKGIRKYWHDDKTCRQVINVTIKRNEKEIEFNYGLSINDTEFLTNSKLVNNVFVQQDFNQRKKIIKNKDKFFTELVYSILCCSKTDYYIEQNFDDFIYEFGYTFETEKEYIKVKQLHLDCLEQSQKIQYLFSEKEIESFPS